MKLLSGFVLACFALNAESAELLQGALPSGVILAEMNGMEYRRPISGVQMLTESDRRRYAAGIADWVLSARIDEAAAKMGISVTDAEQQAVLASAHDDLDADVIRLNRVREALPRALREALNSPEHEKDIFKKDLNGLMSYGIWQGHLSRYNSEDKINELEKMPVATTNDLVRPNSAVRFLVLKKKLREEITKGVTVADADLIKAHSYLQSTNSLQDVLEDLKTTLTEQRKEECWQAWLHAQLVAATVKIQDPELRAAYEKYAAQYGISCASTAR